MKKKYVFIIALVALAIMLSAMVIGKPFVNRYFCVGCGDCVKHCPTQAITLVSGKALIDTETCIDCGFCIKNCQYIAIRRAK
jgi:ferredoxin